MKRDQATKRYGVRRFAPRGSRPDCFEVYDISTNECASFGMRKYEAEQAARAMNAQNAADARAARRAKP